MIIKVFLAFFLFYSHFGNGHIVVKGSSGHYLINGSLNQSQTAIFYSVEDGHQVFVSEKKVNIKPNSHSFEIHIDIPTSKLPQNGTLILNLYMQGDQGKFVQNEPVVLEKFTPK